MPKDHELVIRAARAISSRGDEVACTIGVNDGRIADVAPAGAELRGAREMDLDGDVVLMPGLVDTHAHISEPGTDLEGFETATKSAAAGGITTLVDMPLDNIPSTVTVEALEQKRTAARGRIHVDVGFWGGLIPGYLDALAPLWDAGALGFKCFLIDTGSPDFPHVSVELMEMGLGVGRDLGAPLLVHAESDEVARAIETYHGRSYAAYLATRPREIENVAVAQVIDAARRTGGHAHIVHLSSGDAVPLIAAARKQGVTVTAETCPHYLTVAAEEIRDGDTRFKCSPPIREASNREPLWSGLGTGVLDLVVSDHSPGTVAMKKLDTGDFGSAWAGISSLQLGLPVVWTLARQRGIPLGKVAGWMSTAPAALAGLGRKGRIQVGFDADFCVFAPDGRSVVDVTRLHHKNAITPYAGRTLDGV
ncbi:MAG: allantoinase AllB, partial [Candidatus Dormibacteraeota bacterium]|nr:allantoinase AllB [Candidatus Dormibacteraeota bacterium]